MVVAVFWLVVGGGRYILAGCAWRWAAVAGGGRCWMMVGGGGYISAGGGWWWVLVDGGGSRWIYFGW